MSDNSHLERYDYVFVCYTLIPTIQVNANTIVTVWKDIKNNQEDTWQNYMLRVSERGYKILLSAPWYLNVISYGQDYRDYYPVEPFNFTSENSIVQSRVIRLWRPEVIV